MPTPARPNAAPLAPDPSQPDRVPVLLWNAVVRARVVLAQLRQQPQSAAVPEARADLLDALQAYVGSLERRGRPIPYAIRDELRIQQLTSPRLR